MNRSDDSTRRGPVLGIDLGGTNLRGAVLDTRAEPTAASLAAVTRAARAPGSVDELGEALTRLTAAQVAPSAVAIALPGLVEETTAQWMPNLPWLDGVDLGEVVRGALDAPIPVVVANDAQLALVGEASWGAARRRSDALLLAIGTGIGSAVFADGRVIRGERGAACSFGWACADLADGGDPEHGWLERHAAGRALDALAPSGDGRELVRAARDGDERARAALAPVADALGVALAGAVALLAPQVVVIAGGVADALDLLGPPLVEAMRRHLPAHLHDVEVRSAAFGPLAGVAGACRAAQTIEKWWEVRR